MGKEDQMLARQVTIHGSSVGIDAAVRVQEEHVVPVLRACPGFVAQIFLADRQSGTLIGTSYWATEADMVASEATVQPGRQRVAQAVAAEAPPDVRIYEVPVFVIA
jgi:hypothetical protein